MIQDDPTFRMGQKATRETLKALRTALYREDVLGLIEVLDELTNDERWFIFGRLEAYEKTMIGELRETEL